MPTNLAVAEEAAEEAAEAALLPSAIQEMTASSPVSVRVDAVVRAAAVPLVPVAQV